MRLLRRRMIDSLTPSAMSSAWLPNTFSKRLAIFRGAKNSKAPGKVPRAAALLT